MTTRETYITTGPVRGDCPHHHRSLAAAARCLGKDQRDCERVGGYSDRRVAYADGTDLDEDEAELALAIARGTYPPRY